ncbi:MAG TPA: FAD:protein FMN transferase [Verrucomicrobiales bacterium]|nr:FAD:protein FMN transferase [Verrucomicrobiales bacterium]
MEPESAPSNCNPFRPALPFLKLAAARIKPGLAALLLAMLTAGCTTLDQPSPSSAATNRFAFAQAQMGLEFRITLFAESEEPAQAAAGAAFSRIAALNSVLSDYDADSELSHLSAASGTERWVTVSPDLWRVLSEGQRLASATEGAFDLTVGPSVNLWRRVRRQEQLPDASLLELMRSRVGHLNLELDPVRQAARMLKPEMRLDAGGIAKGFAMDEAMMVLKSHGVRSAMIQGGGDLIVSEAPPGTSGWKVALAGLETDPASMPNPPVLSLENRALATSGDLFQFVEIDGVRYSHIVDPRTGIGLTNRILVHVVAPDGMTADGTSTAASVLGAERGLALASGLPGVEVQITWRVGEEKEQVQSPGFFRSLSAERRTDGN